MSTPIHGAVAQALHEAVGSLVQPRVFVWFAPGLANALAARQCLAVLARTLPKANIGMVGPRQALCLFEMDDRVQVFVPQLALTPRRPAQARLSYWFAKRAQNRKLATLKADLWIGIGTNGPQRSAWKAVCGSQEPSLEFAAQSFEADAGHLPNDALQAGPEALAWATGVFRKWHPTQAKRVAVLGIADMAQSQLKQRLAACPPGFLQLVLLPGADAPNRFLQRTQPDLWQVGLDKLLGMLVYADQVMSFEGDITRLCVEIGREDRLLLAKSDSLDG